MTATKKQDEVECYHLLSLTFVLEEMHAAPSAYAKLSLLRASEKIYSVTFKLTDSRPYFKGGDSTLCNITWVHMVHLLSLELTLEHIKE